MRRARLEVGETDDPGRDFAFMGDGYQYIEGDKVY